MAVGRESFLEELRERVVYQFLDVIIMLFLTKPNKAKYPKGISMFCETMFGVKINPDSLYSLLLTLERKGLIQGECKEIIEKRTIRLYHLTDEGKELVEQFLASHEEMMGFIRYMFENQENATMHPQSFGDN